MRSGPSRRDTASSDAQAAVGRRLTSGEGVSDLLVEKISHASGHRDSEIEWTTGCQVSPEMLGPQRSSVWLRSTLLLRCASDSEQCDVVCDWSRSTSRLLRNVTRSATRHAERPAARQASRRSAWHTLMLLRGAARRTHHAARFAHQAACGWTPQVSWSAEAPWVSILLAY